MFVENAILNTIIIILLGGLGLSILGFFFESV